MTPRSQSTLPDIALDGHGLDLQAVASVADRRAQVRLSPAAEEQLAASRRVIEDTLASRAVVYGVTTGFGKFKDTYIEPEDSKVLQRNLILSHAAGVGPHLDTRTVRAIMLLRANALAKGHSGIRPEVVQLLIACLNRGVHPLVPEQGSVGASGDLSPLAHLALVLIGCGQAELDRERLPGAEALSRAGLKPVELQAKEGLALTNGTQFMTALGVLSLLSAEQMARTADLIGAMSLEALLGTASAFAEPIQRVRPHRGQADSAYNLRQLLADSTIMESHRDCRQVQDAYSLRCMPQVHGASRQAFAHARSVLEVEVNSATDNPLVFAEGILSGGNFHGQPVALALDYMAIALAELASISERRTERLVNPALSNGLPPFLTSFGGLNSGFMVAQYTAAALVSENKALCHPASVDSIPTSANQEDHVSMGPIAARKARQILDNLKKVLAIELLCACQGLDFRMRDLASAGSPVAAGRGVRAAHKVAREKIPHMDEDKELYIDIDAAVELVASGKLLDAASAACGELR